jgi:hypothetical protein
MLKLKNAVRLILLAQIITLLLAACSQSSGSVDAVKAFLDALVAKDIDKIPAVACAAWEIKAAVEFDAFGAVTAKLDNVSCKETGTEGEFTLVTCQGQIVLDYNGENRNMSLEDRVYQTKQESGKWKVCGYTDK